MCNKMDLQPIHLQPINHCSPLQNGKYLQLLTYSSFPCLTLKVKPSLVKHEFGDSESESQCKQDQCNSDAVLMHSQFSIPKLCMIPGPCSRRELSMGTLKQAIERMQGCICQGGEGRDADGLLLPFPFFQHTLEQCIFSTHKRKSGKQKHLSHLMAAPSSDVCPQSTTAQALLTAVCSHTHSQSPTAT